MLCLELARKVYIDAYVDAYITIHSWACVYMLFICNVCMCTGMLACIRITSLSSVPQKTRRLRVWQ